MVTLTQKLILVFSLAAFQCSASARGSLTLKHSEFDGPPLLEAQEQHQTQMIAEIEGDAEFGGHTLLEYSLRGIASSNAYKDFTGDVRVLRLLYESGNWEWSIGQQDIRWGFLNAYNPTDSINPQDLAFDFQGKTHLGQPAITGRYYGDSWNITALIARTRSSRFAEYEDHFRISPLNFGEDRFEKSQTEPKLALRLFKSIGNAELAISHFYGHQNRPVLSPKFLDTDILLSPTYRLVQQSGTELQYILGDYVLRSELAYTKTHNSELGYHQFSAGLGIERVIYGFLGNSDLLLYAEVYHSAQSENAPPTGFDHDWVFGARYITNNASNAELKLQWIYDQESGSSMLESQFQRAWGQRFSLALKGYGFSNTEDDTALSSFQKDSNLSLEMGYHF